MPRRPKSTSPDASAPVPTEILDQFVGQGPISHEGLEAAVRRFKKAIIERALGGELTHHRGYPPGGTKPQEGTNHRNGTSGKTILTDDGALAIDVPRDREGTFEPRFIPKHERRFTGFDDKILALYARGMTVREIQGFLAEMYAVEVSPDLISTVTDAVVAEVSAGAKFWMKVFTDLKTRGCADILIAVADGLKGMSEALAAVFPATTRQTCIVHLIRHSLDFANWKERKPLATALRAIYTAPGAEAAGTALDAFEHGPWGVRFPTVVASWRRAWAHVIPCFAFPPEVRRVIYTTNALESVHAQLRKIIKTRGHFRNDDAATKLIWLALRNITAKWERGAPSWRTAMRQFAILGSTPMGECPPSTPTRESPPGSTTIYQPRATNQLPPTIYQPRTTNQLPPTIHHPPPSTHPPTRRVLDTAHLERASSAHLGSPIDGIRRQIARFPAAHAGASPGGSSGSRRLPCVHR